MSNYLGVHQPSPTDKSGWGKGGGLMYLLGTVIVYTCLWMFFGGFGLYQLNWSTWFMGWFVLIGLYSMLTHQ